MLKNDFLSILNQTDFYGENFDSFYGTQLTSRTLTTTANNHHEQQHAPTANQNLNISIYSQQSTVLSTIKSSDTNRHTHSIKSANKKSMGSMNEAQQEVEEAHNFQDLQATIDTIMSEANPENYETDLNEKDALRANEWSIHLFCIKLFDIITDNLHRDQSAMVNIFEILNNLFTIMNECKSEWSSFNLVLIL